MKKTTLYSGFGPRPKCRKKNIWTAICNTANTRIVASNVVPDMDLLTTKKYALIVKNKDSMKPVT